MGDPPPDPETAPLEVVIDGCELNRDEVAEGSHDVALVGDGALTVTDARDQEVLSLPGGSRTLVTTVQTYTFTCSVDDTQTTSTLKSVASSSQ